MKLLVQPDSGVAPLIAAIKNELGAERVD